MVTSTKREKGFMNFSDRNTPHDGLHLRISSPMPTGMVSTTSEIAKSTYGTLTTESSGRKKPDSRYIQKGIWIAWPWSIIECNIWWDLFHFLKGSLPCPWRQWSRWMSSWWRDWRRRRAAASRNWSRFLRDTRPSPADRILWGRRRSTVWPIRKKTVVKRKKTIYYLIDVI